MKGIVRHVLKNLDYELEGKKYKCLFFKLRFCYVLQTKINFVSSRNIYQSK